MELAVQDGQTMVCIGDSITDCGRRDAAAPFGNGYASLLIEMVTAWWPERTIEYVNRGIGGDRVTGLRERWEEDVLAHRPDWLSVLIGINDLHSYLGDPAAGVSVPLYRECYDDILTRTREQTKAQIVLLDPFYIDTGESGDAFRAQVRQIIPEYIAVVHEMSERHGTRLVKLHDVFQNHLTHRPAETFCPEPVHPNRAGHVIIAAELLKTLSA
jgi:lysophospholipase L1-like esterase